MKKTIIKLIVAFIVVGALGGGGYYGYKKYKESKTTASNTSYMTVFARKMNMQVNIQGTGSVYAAVSKDISANNSGEIQSLNVKVGDTIKKGTKICTVYNDQLQQDISKAQNNLEKQQLQLSKSKTADDTSIQDLAINDAQRELNYAIEQRNKMTLTSPIDGMVTVVNNTTGDSVQPGKAIVSVIDTNSLKIKVAVDELDISKVKVGQTAEIKFGAIKDKVYEGSVEEISQIGNNSNNVTTYDVVVSIKNPADIKLGMNANVNILVDSKENALTIPAEALIERNGNKYVMVANSDGSASTSSENTSNGDQSTRASRSQASGSSRYAMNQQGQNRQGGNASNYTGAALSGSGKLVEIKTGLENENYIEVTEGLTEGQKILVPLSKTTSTSNTNMRSGFGGGMGGSFSGSFGGGMRQQSDGSNGR